MREIQLSFSAFSGASTAYPRRLGTEDIFYAKLNPEVAGIPVRLDITYPDLGWSTHSLDEITNELGQVWIPWTWTELTKTVVKAIADSIEIDGVQYLGCKRALNKIKTIDERITEKVEKAVGVFAW